MPRLGRDTTIPEPAPDSDVDGLDRPEVFVLAMAWSKDEPWRLGQVLLIPPGEPGPPVFFGRGQPNSGQLPLVEHRPERTLPSMALACASISRVQLEIRSFGLERLSVRNVGKCQLLRNGSPISQADFVPGDLLQLGQQLLFVVTRRPERLAIASGAYPEFPFAMADAYGIVGESAVAWRLRAHVASTGPRPGHVLVSGPTGCGKELVAQAVHSLSSRRHRRLVARSAATIPESLFDAELFGNSKNYPNAGMPERPGLVGEADGSTLFLDEIGEIAAAPQAHLLRLLDGGEYHRLGEARARRADLRILAATNRAPSCLKADLLARLKLRISVPALSERVEDVPLIVKHLLQRAAARGDSLARSRFPDGDVNAEPCLGMNVVRRLLERRYDANVRELESALYDELSAPELRSAPSDAVDRSHLGADRAAQPGEKPPVADDRDALSPERIQRCLDENNGVLEPTWRALGMKNRFTLMRFIRKYRLEVRRRPGSSHRPLRAPSRRRD